MPWRSSWKWRMGRSSPGDIGSVAIPSSISPLRSPLGGLCMRSRRGTRRRWGTDVIDDDTRSKTLGRLRRIEGQVQGIQRMVEEDKYCVDILLQLTAVQGAVEQVQRLLLGRHIESCVADAIRSGSTRDRQKKVDELLEVFSRFGGR